MTDLLPCVEIEPPNTATRAVIWMHGLGANGHDFEPIVPHLGLSAEPGVRFVFPHAPSIPVTINGGMVMPAWFDIAHGDDGFRCDEASVRRAAGFVTDLIERERQRGIESKHVVLAGFSQGGSMALHVGLRHTAPLAGVMALSTALMFPEALAAERSPVNQDISIFQAHGVHDPMIVLGRGLTTRDKLRELGYQVQWREYPMAHEVCQPEITDIGGWLKGALE